jgi:hypothetical protein
LLDVTLKSVARNFLDLTIYDFLRKLAKVEYGGDPMVFNALHQQSLSPKVVKQIELFELSVVLYNEDVKDQLFSKLKMEWTFSRYA